MRPHLGIAAFVVFGFFAQACSSGDKSPAGDEHVGETTQAITTACSLATLGLPCDPDGPGKPLSECEGVCWFATTGLVTCAPVKTGSMDGISCGTQAGVGDNACKHFCSGKTCLAATASAGTACRPNSGAGICEGQCDGGGHCAPIAQPCPEGRNEQLCTVNFCDQKDATKCTVLNLSKNTICSDANACSISSCNGLGVCIKGGTAGCNDGNACTDDTCDPDSGACLGQFNDANGCSDSNACTSGDFCKSGVCHAGTTTPDCDDQNPCTTDSCDPNVGCAHVQITCSDGNACTTDSCNPNTGACSNIDLGCDDQNPCTVDACSTLTGCSHVAMTCDDDNACTADSCAAGECKHDPVSCADADACTDDSCVPATGCAHAPIQGCGTGGTGGSGGAAGTGGTDSASGASGEGGEGGTGTGGTESTAGTSTGGTDATSGSANGGEPATGGTGPGPQAGDTGLPSAGSTAAGSSTGGSSSAGTDSTAGTGTHPGVAGEDSVGGSDAHEVNSSSGCGCRVAETPRQTTGAWALALLGALAVVRRRKHG